MPEKAETVTTVRLVHRRTGSVAVVPEERAAALKTLGYVPEAAPAKKAAAKK
jgi:hypothetical protein